MIILPTSLVLNSAHNSYAIEKCKRPSSTQFLILPTSFYDVHGKDLKEAVENSKDPNSQGDKTLVSHTFVKLEESPTLTNKKSGKITCINAKISLTIHLPKWIEKCEKAKDEWDKFVQRALDHEQGHVKFLKKDLENLHKEILGHEKGYTGTKEFKSIFEKMVKDSEDRFHSASANGEQVPVPKNNIICEKPDVEN